MKVTNASVKLCVIALLCILSLPAIEYVGGLICFPLIILPLPLPAQTVPYGIWLFVVVKLLCLVIRAIKNRSRVLMPLGALVISFSSMWLFFASHEPMSGFVLGLKTRFAHSAGYEAVREFAKEVSQKPEGIAIDDRKINSRDHLDKRRREELTSRYPFLSWGFGMGKVYFFDGVVSFEWGFGLAGHWGFRVSPNGPLRDLQEDSTIIRVSDDIQFVYHEN